MDSVCLMDLKLYDGTINHHCEWLSMMDRLLLILVYKEIMKWESDEQNVMEWFDSLGW